MTDSMNPSTEDFASMFEDSAGAATLQEGKVVPATVISNNGDYLVLDDGSRIRVRASEERVADIRADSANSLARIAWHLGNRHWPTQLIDGGLRIRYDHVLVDMVAGLGGQVTVRDAAFHPESGAYAHEH